MARTRVVIDTDPGVDDAVAILLALASPEIDVVGLTTVNGNVGIEATTLNARRLLSLAARRDIPIARGASAPLVGSAEDASEVHGADGLGDLDWPDPVVDVIEHSAVELITALAKGGPLTLIAIGPLTNLAMLLREAPDVVQQIERVVIMGGASFHGNVTPAAEFNIWVDPEAAREVLAAAWPITILPLDLTHQAFLTDADLTYLRGLGTAVARRVADMLEPYAEFHQEWYLSRDLIMHDAMAVYEVIDPAAIAKQGVAVEVEIAGEHSRGATWFHRSHRHGESQVRVGINVDNDRFTALLRQRLATFD